jgi:MarR family
MSDPGERDGSWTLLTGHGHVLVEIARNPGARIRDISAAAGITERTVQAIVADLEAAGYLTRTRTGRRTRYTVNPDSSFRHPAQEGLRVGPFLAVLAASEPGPAAGPPGGGPAAAAPADHGRAGPGTPGPGRSG